MDNNNLPILEMRNISKSFGPVCVLNDVNLVLNRGEVLGLIGENGAGKSTLIKILCGIYQKDQGQIFWKGNPVNIQTAEQAQRLGISTIYQELSLMPDMNAVENIFINREIIGGHKTLFSPIHYKEMKKKAQKILWNDLHVEIDVEKPLRNLTLAQKQMIEISRTVYADAQVIIMDEPTAALEDAERKQLFNVIRNLKEKGRSVIFISHHLDEIIEICDRIDVLRDGKKVADGLIEDFSVERIIEEMIGKTLQQQYPKVSVDIGGELLRVDGLEKKGCFEGVSFTLHEGEILGIVGLEGCGKNEVIRSLFGITAYDQGEVFLRGEKVELKKIKTSMKHKIAFVPAERKIDGLFLKQDIAWNTTISSLYKIIHAGTIITKREVSYTEQFMDQMQTKAKGYNQNISLLSGGNQQKVMLSRWIMTEADIFLLEDPTRGIDVNAKTIVYSTISRCVMDKKGVIIVSSSEEEVIGICDRIIVMRAGKITACLNAAETNTAEIKKYSVKENANEREKYTYEKA